MRRARWMGSGLGLVILIGLLGAQCGRERVNPLDPNFPQFSRPSQPSNVTATGSFGRITVAWVAPTGATDILGYGVYRAAGSPTATYTFLRGDARGDTLVSTGGTSFVDSTFTGETAIYYYRVAAVNKNRVASELSNPARGELLKDTSPPAAPQNVSAQSDSISGAVTLSWSPPTTDPGGRELTGLSRFKVYRAEGTADAFVQLTEMPADAKSFVDRNVKGGTRYFYQVSALDPVGNESARSTVVSLVTAGVSVPTGLRAAGEVGRIALVWNASTDDGLRGYNVYRSDRSDGAYTRLGPAGSFTTGQTAYTDSNLVGGSTFFYKVSAVTNRGEGAQTPFVSATAQAVLGPAGLRATGEVGRIALTWNPSTDDGLRGYNVYRSDRSDGAYTRLGPAGAVFTTGQTAYTDSNLVGGSTFFYKVSAVTNRGEGAQTPFVSATAQADNVPPAAPQNVSVQSDSISGAVTLGWSPPTADSGGRELTGLSRFRIYRAEGTADAFVQLTEMPADAKSFVDRNVKGGTRYFYQVSALDPVGNESARSTVVSLVTAGVSVPTGLRAAGEVGRIALAWNASTDDGLRGYNVYRSDRSDGNYTRLGPAGAAFTTGQTAYTDSNLVGGSTYFYKISAVTTRGTGAQTLFVSATAQADNVPPAAPGNLSAQLDERSVGRVTLTWSAPATDATGRDLTGLSGYRVYRSKGGTTSFVQVASTAQNTYVDTGLEPLTTYFYAVSAYDPSNNESARTAQAQVVTRGIATPSGVRATGDIGKITVVWNSNTETELLGYNVYRSTRSDTNYVRLPGNEGTPYTTGQTSYIDSNLVANSRFYYRVSAVGSGVLGEGQRSVPVAATVLADDQPPAAPSNLLAELDANVITRVTLRWNAPNRDANGRELTGLSGYRVFRNNVQIATTAATTTTYVDNTVEPLTSYTYAVSAVDPTGNVSSLSNTVPVTTKGVAVPASVAAAGDVNLIRVTWTANIERDLIGYRVYRSTSSTGTFSPIRGVQDTVITTTETAFVDSNLTAGTQRYYKVRAVATSGVSDLSRFAVATAQEDTRAPATPDINFFFVTVNAADARILDLKWRAPTTDVGGAAQTGLKGYRVYRTGTAGSFVQIAEVQHPTVTYTDNDPALEFTTVYQYKVSAFDEKGNESPPTTAVSQQTGGVPPPTNLVVTASAVDATTGQAVLTWSAPTKPGAADYAVERQQVGTTSSSTFTVVTFTPNTTITDTGLTRGRTYAYRVRSRNTARTLQSDPTNVVPVLIP